MSSTPWSRFITAVRSRTLSIRRPSRSLSSRSANLARAPAGRNLGAPARRERARRACLSSLPDPRQPAPCGRRRSGRSTRRRSAGRGPRRSTHRREAGDIIRAEMAADPRPAVLDGRAAAHVDDRTRGLTHATGRFPRSEPGCACPSGRPPPRPRPPSTRAPRSARRRRSARAAPPSRRRPAPRSVS